MKVASLLELNSWAKNQSKSGHLHMHGYQTLDLTITRLMHYIDVPGYTSFTQLCRLVSVPNIEYFHKNKSLENKTAKQNKLM